jgi:hypothetical protein
MGDGQAAGSQLSGAGGGAAGECCFPQPIHRLNSADETGKGTPIMQITVTVSDEVVREAGVRGLPVIDFIESLIDSGMRTVKDRPMVDDAIERIRALRTVSRGPSR